MQNKPEIIQLLAQKTRTSPEWTGPSGVFMNPFSGYKGVEIFVGYVKHLKLANGNKIPDSLPRKANDYLDYLNEFSEDKKEEYSTYFQKTVPKISNMIRDAKMTKESILEFANIFNELEIGQNPATIIADYQAAISDAFKFKMQTSGGASQSQTQAQKSDTETYKQLALSEKEKANVIEKCRQKGVMISSSQLDNYYVGSSGAIYSGEGEAVTSTAIGLAVTQTLQYQVGAGNAQKLALTATEITKILAVCQRKGLKVTKEDLENVHLDKDGQLYFGDGTAITDVDIGTEISQTDTYADAYSKFADKRGEKQVAPETRDDKEEPALIIPEKINEGGPGGLQRILEGTEATRQAGSLTKGSSSQLSQIILPTGEDISLEGSKGLSLSGGIGLPKNGLSIPYGWYFNGGTRKKALSQRTGQRKMTQEVQDEQGGQTQPSGDEGMPNETEQRQPERRATDSGMGNSQWIPVKKKRWLWYAAAPVATAGAIKGGSSATFFILSNVIDSHYFISNILKILFP